MRAAFWVLVVIALTGGCGQKAPSAVSAQAPRRAQDIRERAYGAAESAIQAQLQGLSQPSFAPYQSSRVAPLNSTTANAWGVESYLDARDTTGQTVRREWFCIVRWRGPGESDFTTEQVRIDDGR